MTVDAMCSGSLNVDLMKAYQVSARSESSSERLGANQHCAVPLRYEMDYMILS